MNPNLQKLQAYPFERLSALKKHISPPSHLNHISLSIGEPKHPAPKFVKDVLANSIDEIERYPTTRGTSELRNTICNWLTKRFNLTPYSVLPDKNVLPVCGTREAIFAFTQSAINVKDCTDLPVVVAPNPFYQIYEGAALLAGAEPVYLNCDFEKNFSPDLINVSPEVWERCQLLQLCSPGNPTGAVMSLAAMEQAIHLADKYDFIIASDECYSEVYLDEQNPPVGLLEACRHIGRDDYSRCVVFHSLSKRSNLPGLRSGFIAGDASLIAGFLKYRTYHGSSMSLPVQKASIAAWSDEDHTIANRDLYRHKVCCSNSNFAVVVWIFLNPTPAFICGPKLRSMISSSHESSTPRKMSPCYPGSSCPGRATIATRGKIESEWHLLPIQRSALRQRYESRILYPL